jgi:threonine dehydrogenase-like Zn-dependent dehydrogenase
MVGEQVAIFGQGIVGLLLTSLLGRYPLASLVTLDMHPLRRRTSESLGAHASVDSTAKDALKQLLLELQGSRPFPGADLTYELSGNPEALDQAIIATGFSGRIVVGSWYGRKTTDLHLGGRFHRSRIRLISSQVSTIAPEFTGRWNRLRRYQVTWQMLQQVKPARFITHRFPFSQATKAYELIDRNPTEVLQVILTY